MKIVNKTNLALVLVVVMSYLSMFNTSGSYQSNGGRTNAPFDNGTCSTGSSCHSSAGSFTPSVTIQLLSGTTAVTSYTPGNSYTVKITVSSSTNVTSSTRYGFQAVCVKSGSPYTDVNQWGSMPSGTKKWAINSRTYASHSTPLSSGVISIPWTAPSASTGNVTFYASGLVANHNFQQTGDNVAHTSLTVSLASSGCTTPTVNFTKTDVKCYEGNTGSIVTATSGGSSPFSFDWSGPNGYTSGTQNISGLKAGQYTLIVTANGGCKDTFKATISEPTALHANVTGATMLCAGSTLSLNSSPSGGNGGAYTFSWIAPSGSSLGNNPGITVSSAGDQDNGDYIARIFDAKGCSIDDTIHVQVDSLPQSDGLIVNELSNNTIKFSINNPRYIKHLLWIYGDGKTDTLLSPNHTYTSYGSYVTKLIMMNDCGSDTLDYPLNIWPEGIEHVGHGGKQVSIYPNPAGDFVMIHTSNGQHIRSVTAISLQGSVAYRQENIERSSVELSTAQLAAGTYILQVVTDEFKETLPVVIRH